MTTLPKNLPSNEHLNALATPFGLSAVKLEFLRCSQNFVYSGQAWGKRCILRISKGRYRTKAEVEAELRWISVLSERGVNVCKSIPTEAGDSCAALELDGEIYVAACFEYAPGKVIERHEMDESLHERLGVLLGQMQTRSGIASNRPSWNESRLLREDLTSAKGVLSEKFCESVADLIRTLKRHPQTSANYGLMHGDVSFGNCFLHQGELWIFDFDNCENGYFLQDLATVLYDSIYCQVINKFADEDLNNRIAPRWTAFLKGYAKTGPLKKINVGELKKFFLLREAIICIHYYRTLEMEQASDSFKAGLAIMKQNIENQEHQVDFNLISR